MTDHKDFEPQDVQAGLESGRYILIDVREPGEFADERIPGAILAPLSAFNPKTLPRGDDREIILHCKSGGRSGRALQMCRDAGIDVAGHVKGGILNWKTCQLATDRAENAPTGMTIQQAVMAMASFLMLVSVGMGVVFSPWWLVLGAAVSGMLLQASFTGFCPASSIFARLGFRPG
ncbi:rhodanese-like domain-containing protein [uncultured Maricaulis sp.]|uniref:rhodanese-like domain-containing protein n=1 Tax=uncultured Maricaulis sp. TaxID=174710 RepID=UPI0025F8B867|nr:rhodanese-like domain-containing protein [uncultured Maricaulis sp.]